jgi:S-(hydroxymethyl)glutathione dehydrogenase/alcohol dehydrogenase
MKTNAALLFSQPGKWEVTEVDLDEPKTNEVLVKMVAAGLCHSDDHMATGDMPSMKLPIAGGHEGAGIVEAVGPNVSSVAPGDHVVLQFIPGCGRCRWCASGQQNLCDSGGHAPRRLPARRHVPDAQGRDRHRANGHGLDVLRVQRRPVDQLREDS